MRKHFIVIILAVLGMLSAQAQPTGIIPTPQQVEFLSGSYQLSAGQEPMVETLITTRFISTIPEIPNAEQAYTLEVKEDKIEIHATTEQGLFYGQQSVKQLLRYFKDESGRVSIPCMHIVDYPMLKYRGWMDDISRGPIPNMEFLKRAIATLAEYKFNFFNLYTEHVFKLDQYPDIAPTDGLTAEEIKELEDYARQYHIELIGNQQCFAHAEETFKIPFYQPMADTKFNWNPGEPRTYDFLRYELETVAKAYQSPFFNINCDETESLGSGRAKEYVKQKKGAEYVYAQHIQWVYDVLKSQGKRVMMWGDIAAKDSAITMRLPKDIMMLIWSYSPSDSYVDMIEPFERQGFEFMVAPGMSMWGSVFPSEETYTKNIANLVRDGYQHGAVGMMNTAWDDSGESLFNSTWHGMAWAAEMSWQPIRNTEPTKADQERTERLRVFNEAFAHTFMMPDNGFQLMKELEHVAIPNFFNSLALYESVWDFYPSKISETAYQQYLQTSQLIESRKDQYKFTASVSQQAPQYDAAQRIAWYVCLRLQTASRIGMLRYKVSQYLQGNKQFSEENIKTDIQETLNLLHETKLAYMKLWDEECRPYCRNIVEARYDQLAQELMDIPYHVVISSRQNDRNEVEVSLRTLFNDQEIYYTLDGREPQLGETYHTPLTLSQSATVRAMTFNPFSEKVLSEQYILIHKALHKIAQLNTAYSEYRPQYAASGKMGLADGVIGSESYLDGCWQGYWGSDIDVEFDFGKPTVLRSFKTRFLQNIHDWIMCPQTVELYTSKDGVNYKLYQTLTVPNVEYSAEKTGIFTLQADDLSLKARYVRVVVKNAGSLPPWHQAPGQPSYIFCDEMIFE
jgi:hypothetical protein